MSKFPLNDKFYNVHVNGESYEIMGENLCAFVNDCTSAKALSYNVDQFNELTENIPCFDGFSYNALPVEMNGKVFILSNRLINAGEEIFYSYGWKYWRSRIRIALNDGSFDDLLGLDKKYGTLQNGSIVLPFSNV